MPQGRRSNFPASSLPHRCPAKATSHSPRAENSVPVTSFPEETNVPPYVSPHMKDVRPTICEHSKLYRLCGADRVSPNAPDRFCQTGFGSETRGVLGKHVRGRHGWPLTCACTRTGQTSVKQGERGLGASISRESKFRAESEGRFPTGGGDCLLGALGPPTRTQPQM